MLGNGENWAYKKPNHKGSNVGWHFIYFGYSKLKAEAWANVVYKD